MIQLACAVQAYKYQSTRSAPLKYMHSKNINCSLFTNTKVCIRHSTCSHWKLKAWNGTLAWTKCTIKYIHIWIAYGMIYLLRACSRQHAVFAVHAKESAILLVRIRSTYCRTRTVHLLPYVVLCHTTINRSELWWQLTRTKNCRLLYRLKAKEWRMTFASRRQKWSQ